MFWTVDHSGFEREGGEVVSEKREQSAPQYYVASRASIPERGQMWRRFRSQGMRISATWIDEDGRGGTADFAELWQRLEKEIKSSTALLFYVESDDFPLKGALVEVGMAIAMGKPVLVFHPGVEIDQVTYMPLGSWIKHPGVMLMTSCIEDWAHAAPVAVSAPEAPTLGRCNRSAEPHERAALCKEWEPMKEVMPTEARSSLRHKSDTRPSGEVAGGPTQWEIEQFCGCVKYLLDWMPVCSIGSSGHKRRENVELWLKRFGEDGSLKSEVGVKADLEHPGNDTGGEIASRPVNTTTLPSEKSGNAGCPSQDRQAEVVGGPTESPSVETLLDRWMVIQEADLEWSERGYFTNDDLVHFARWVLEQKGIK
jgi:hypothetical protein